MSRGILRHPIQDWPPRKATHANTNLPEARTVGAIGFTVKSGWACTVLVALVDGAARVLDHGRLELSDPALPESKQPYHDGAGTARKEGPALSRLLGSVRTFAAASLKDRIARFRTPGYPLKGAGIVVGSLIDPRQIANDHIRIHALEGRLFREIVQDAAERAKLPCFLWRERDLLAAARETLGKPEAQLRIMLRDLGKPFPGPWRSEQKAAALAAWLVLTEAPRARASKKSLP